MKPLVLAHGLAMLLLALPAAAEDTPPRPLPVVAAPDIGLPHPPLVDCRPLYTPAPRPIGPASANPEEATEGLLVTGMACTPAQ